MGIVGLLTMAEPIVIRRSWQQRSRQREQGLLLGSEGEGQREHGWHGWRRRATENTEIIEGLSLIPRLLRRVELGNQEIKKWLCVDSEAGAGRI